MIQGILLPMKTNQVVVMREMQENYYLVLFMFASQLGPISLLDY